jgi:hypothetical protein
VQQLLDAHESADGILRTHRCVGSPEKHEDQAQDDQYTTSVVQKSPLIAV